MYINKYIIQSRTYLMVYERIYKMTFREICEKKTTQHNNNDNIHLDSPDYVFIIIYACILNFRAKQRMFFCHFLLFKVRLTLCSSSHPFEWGAIAITWYKPIYCLLEKKVETENWNKQEKKPNKFANIHMYTYTHIHNSTE